MMCSIVGLSWGSWCKHLRMRARNILSVTMVTCSSRLSGSGSFPMLISHRRAPKLYTSTWRQRNERWLFKTCIIQGNNTIAPLQYSSTYALFDFFVHIWHFQRRWFLLRTRIFIKRLKNLIQHFFLFYPSLDDRTRPLKYFTFSWNQ